MPKTELAVVLAAALSGELLVVAEVVAAPNKEPDVDFKEAADVRAEAPAADVVLAAERAVKSALAAEGCVDVTVGVIVGTVVFAVGCCDSTSAAVSLVAEVAVFEGPLAGPVVKPPKMEAGEESPAGAPNIELAVGALAVLVELDILTAVALVAAFDPLKRLGLAPPPNIPPVLPSKPPPNSDFTDSVEEPAALFPVLVVVETPGGVEALDFGAPNNAEGGAETLLERPPNAGKELVTAALT